MEERRNKGSQPQKGGLKIVGEGLETRDNTKIGGADARIRDGMRHGVAKTKQGPLFNRSINRYI